MLLLRQYRWDAELFSTAIVLDLHRAFPSKECLNGTLGDNGLIRQGELGSIRARRSGIFQQEAALRCRLHRLLPELKLGIMDQASLEAICQLLSQLPAASGSFCSLFELSIGRVVMTGNFTWRFSVFSEVLLGNRKASILGSFGTTFSASQSPQLPARPLDRSLRIAKACYLSVLCNRSANFRALSNEAFGGGWGLMLLVQQILYQIRPCERGLHETLQAAHLLRRDLLTDEEQGQSRTLPGRYP